MATPSQKLWNKRIAWLANYRDNQNAAGDINWDFVQADCHIDFDTPPTDEQFETAVDAFMASA